jgi:two-component system alkaline phosphatase synthesis response regulator PhoP
VSQTVLVVEDEPQMAAVVREYLAKAGFRVLTATDGRMGLLTAQQEKPDLVILDLMLPEMDGLELLSTLRRESRVYVILLTARTEETDKVVGLALGADDYMTKPFSPRELVARVRAVLRRSGPPPGGLATDRIRASDIEIDVPRRHVDVERLPCIPALDLRRSVRKFGDDPMRLSWFHKTF